MPSLNTAAISDRPLLEPVVILFAAIHCEAVAPAGEVLDRVAGLKYAVGTYASIEERDRFYADWSPSIQTPLLLLRASSDDALAETAGVIREICADHPRRAVAVLVADGPEVSGFKMERRDLFYREMAEMIHRDLADIQVFLYSSTWLSQPPRIR